MKTDAKLTLEDASAKVEEENLRNEVQRLERELQECKSQLEAQAAETERLTFENGVLTQAVLNSRKLCIAWEGQTNDGLVQIDRLKDLLEESASWQAPTISPNSDANGQNNSTAAGDQEAVQPNQSDSVNTAAVAALGKMEKQLMEAHVRASRLDTCLRAVAAEISRAASNTSNARHATLPLLLNVETRLSQLLKKTALQTSSSET